MFWNSRDSWIVCVQLNILPRYAQLVQPVRLMQPQPAGGPLSERVSREVWLLHLFATSVLHLQHTSIKVYSFWMATEYIPPRSSQTTDGKQNWGTRVIEVSASA